MIVILLILNSSILKSQNNFEIEVSEGFIFFDYFGNEPKGWDKEFTGYGLQSEINFWYSIYEINKLKVKLGVGYTQLNYLYGYYSHFFAESNNISRSPFINLKFGTEYKPNWSKIAFNLNSTHYFAVGDRFFAEYKWFTNIDIGFKIKLIKHLSLSMWSPITLKPIVDGSRTWKPIEFLKLNYDPWVEMTGLNLGISYEFGK